MEEVRPISNVASCHFMCAICGSEVNYLFSIGRGQYRTYRHICPNCQSEMNLKHSYPYIRLGQFKLKWGAIHDF